MNFNWIQLNFKSHRSDVNRFNTLSHSKAAFHSHDHHTGRRQNQYWMEFCFFSQYLLSLIYQKKVFGRWFFVVIMPFLNLKERRTFSWWNHEMWIKEASRDEICWEIKSKFNLNSISHQRRVFTTCVLISQIITLVSSDPVTRSCVFFGTIMHVIAPLWPVNRKCVNLN